ncbi:hypothetical protein K523DRAFT_254379 [Schizophyllum commune Tattone D]|nr:hypothetical protein K523DRAFT_254379 [Schizophyllum commune Tattone D]
MHTPVFAALCIFMCASGRAIVLKPMQHSWEFDLYAEDGQVKIFPVYEQCETMRLKWDRGTATGATTPYSLLVYNSRYIVPFILDLPSDAEFGYNFEVPFPPGTQMQICMFDANGYTGGCSSVISIVSSATEPSGSCTNQTFSQLQNVDVEANIVSGPLSRTGWIPQTPVFGHSNITKEWDGPVHGHSGAALTPSVQCDLCFEYQLQLDGLSVVGYPLLCIVLKVTDTERNVWSYGLLHSGEGTTSCMAEEQGTVVPVGAAAGAGAGAALLGFVVGALGVWIFLVRHHLKEAISPAGSMNTGLGSSPMRTASQTQLETTPNGPHSSENRARSQSTCRPRGHSRQDGGRNIYVVHSDGGAAPVRVFYEDDEEGVQQLLPNYTGDGGPEDTREPSGSKRKDDHLLPHTAPARAREAARKPAGPR